MGVGRKVRQIGGKAARLCLPVLVLGGCGYVLSTKVTAQHLSNLPAQLAGIPWSAWLAAASFTIISLWAVGRYDGVAHSHFGTRIPNHQARWTGTIAISLAQTLGFGLFTGALARWRLLPDLTLTSALQISAFASISFVASWGVVTALANVFLPGPDWAFWPAMAVLGTIPPGLWLLFRYPHFDLGKPAARLRSIELRLPSLLSVGAILLWTMMDTFAAAGAFYMLLPAEVTISGAAFLPLYMLALGAALISNTPGGVGPFEVMMLGLMPYVPVDALLGSIIAFRLVYYAIPAALAAIAMLVPFRTQKMRSTPTILPNLSSAPNAEIGVIKQNGGYVLSNNEGASAVWPTAQTLTALCDPMSGGAESALKALKQEAYATGRLPILYKCNPQTALAARAQSWSVIHVSDDAILNTTLFQLDVPKRRGLRRKLRAAEKSGVTITSAQSCPQSVPWRDMAAIDTAWQTKHGRARGGTMGRFSPDYLSDHYIAQAYVSGQLVAYASFQRSAREWCLDVMRHSDAMPDGTMHALVVHAIGAAKATGLKRLSLAATPACPDPSSAFYRWAAMKAVEHAGGPGLRQFKSSFAPRWEPRYAAAPNALGLCIGLADITKEVHRPTAIPALAPHLIHNVDENYELASRRAS